MPGRHAISLGLCSVTFRELEPGELVQHAAAAGLGVIEWGSDRHARPDDADSLVRVRELTAAAGLRTCSYGTYFEAGVHDAAQFVALAAAATVLQTDRLRIWAGATASAEADRESRAAVVAGVQSAAGIAAEHGQHLALEFHGGSLTDTAESTLQLLDEIDRTNVTTYWQAPIGVPDAQAVAGLALLLDQLSAVHVFSWWPQDERHPLPYRSGLWSQVFALLAERDMHVEALLEFVPDDDPARLPAEARALADFANGST